MENDLIYDVGMNNGDDTAYYLHKGYRVLAIEADPTLVESARHRFAAEILEGRVEILNIGIGPEDEVAKFYICEEHREWNSFDREIASRDGLNHYAIDVVCRRFRDVLNDYGVPYYLKVDIEGHDHYCLEGLDSDNLPKYVSVELGNVSHLIKLYELGYNAFKCITQNNLEQLQLYSPIALRTLIRSHPQLRRVIRPCWRTWQRVSDAIRQLSTKNETNTETPDQWVFPFGSSGAFGEESDGQWKTFEEATFSWLAYKFGYTHLGSPSLQIWHDVHATRLE